MKLKSVRKGEREEREGRWRREMRERETREKEKEAEGRRGKKGEEEDLLSQDQRSDSNGVGAAAAAGVASAELAQHFDPSFQARNEVHEASS